MGRIDGVGEFADCGRRGEGGVTVRSSLLPVIRQDQRRMADETLIHSSYVFSKDRSLCSRAS